jgi:hypothetical protein
MKAAITVETTKTEQPLSYSGEDTTEIMDFLASLQGEEPTLVQCQMSTEVKGEKRSLNRTAKGEQPSISLLNDIVAWLAEVETKQ